MATARKAPPLDTDDDGDTPDNPPPGFVRIPSRGVLTNPPEDDPDGVANIVEKIRAQITSDDASGIYVRVARFDVNSKSFKWCEDYPATELDSGLLRRLRKTFGAGRYSIRVIGPRGIVTREIVEIESMHEPDPVSNDVGSLASIASILAENQRAFQQTIAETLAANRRDPREEMRETFALIAGMREAFGITGAAAPAPAPNPMEQFRQIVDLVRGVKETTRELADDDKPAADPSDPMSYLPGILEKLAPAIVQQMAGGGAGGAGGAGMGVPVQPLALPPSVAAAPVPAPRVNPDTIEPPAAPVAPAPETPPAPPTAQDLVMDGIIESIADMATNGATPEQGGEHLAELLPDDVLPYLRLPNWFDILLTVLPAKHAPVLREHETWLRAAKAHADKLIAQDIASDDAG